jgi:subtilisin family serine protease
VLLRLEVWPDANFDSAAVAIGSLVEEILERTPAFDWMTVRVRPERVEELTRLNGVSWLEPIRPPSQGHNDEVRAQLQVDTIQAAPYNLSGQGINVGMWDSGAVAAHADFQGRLTVIDTGAGTTDHATHVAGTIAGSGLRSRPIGGAPIPARH